MLDKYPAIGYSAARSRNLKEKAMIKEMFDKVLRHESKTLVSDETNEIVVELDGRTVEFAKRLDGFRVRLSVRVDGAWYCDCPLESEAEVAEAYSGWSKLSTWAFEASSKKTEEKRRAGVAFFKHL